MPDPTPCASIPAFHRFEKPKTTSSGCWPSSTGWKERPHEAIDEPLITLAALLIVAAEPALAQSIDLSPIQSLLQGIVDALTGPLGVVIATLAVLGVFLSWFFNIIDLRQALWVLVGIAGVAAAPTIVAAVFGS